METLEYTPDQMLARVSPLLNIAETAPIYPNAFPAHSPFDVFRCFISKHLSDISGLDANQIYNTLAWTNTFDKGDLILPVPPLLPKGKNPQAFVSEYAQKFPETRLLSQPQASGISLRFDYKDEILPNLVLPQIFASGVQYGLNKRWGLQNPNDPTSAKKKTIIEFSSPNIAKEFHVGHLRSTIIGSFLANVYSGLGWEVIRMNYLGDWGRQFGILAVGWQKYGSEELLEQDPLGHLVDIYVRINAEFEPEEKEYKAAKKRGEDTSALETKGVYGAAKDYVKRMEEGEEGALAIWKRFRDISILKYKDAYARLNIFFDEYSGESEVKHEIMNEAEQILKDKGISEIDEGATIVDFKKHGAKKLGVAIIRNRNDTTSYLLRDVGAAIQRWRQWRMDEMIYVIMSQQKTHVQQFIKILELMGGEFTSLSTKIQHVTFGKILGMSTRKGTVKFLGDVLNDVGAAMHETMRRNQDKYAQVQDPDRVSDALGISSIMVQDMSGKRVNDYNFDLQRMLSFEGDTGPYLQYAHARLCSISRKAEYTLEQLKSADFSLLREPHAINLIRLLGSWPDTLLHTYRFLEPSTTVTYLFRLTHQLSSSYDILKVINAPEGPETSLARAALYEASRQVLWNGMTLIGLSPVERM